MRIALQLRDSVRVTDLHRLALGEGKAEQLHTARPVPICVTDETKTHQIV
jgi:hypothetical protein